MYSVHISNFHANPTLLRSSSAPPPYLLRIANIHYVDVDFILVCHEIRLTIYMIHVDTRPVPTRAVSPPWHAVQGIRSRIYMVYCNSMFSISKAADGPRGHPLDDLYDLC